MVKQAVGLKDAGSKQTVTCFVKMLLKLLTSFDQSKDFVLTMFVFVCVGVSSTWELG